MPVVVQKWQIQRMLSQFLVFESKIPASSSLRKMDQWPQATGRTFQDATIYELRVEPSQVKNLQQDKPKYCSCNTCNGRSSERFACNYTICQQIRDERSALSLFTWLLSLLHPLQKRVTKMHDLREDFATSAVVLCSN